MGWQCPHCGTTWDEESVMQDSAGDGKIGVFPKCQACGRRITDIALSWLKNNPKRKKNSSLYATQIRIRAIYDAQDWIRDLFLSHDGRISESELKRYFELGKFSTKIINKAWKELKDEDYATLQGKTWVWLIRNNPSAYASCREVICPKCKAKIGDRCRTPKGRLATEPHTERTKKYREKIGAKEWDRRHRKGIKNPSKGNREYTTKVESPWWMTKWEKITLKGDMGSPEVDIKMEDRKLCYLLGSGEILYGTIQDIGMEPRKNPPLAFDIHVPPLPFENPPVKISSFEEGIYLLLSYKETQERLGYDFTEQIKELIQLMEKMPTKTPTDGMKKVWEGRKDIFKLSKEVVKQANDELAVWWKSQ